jgi:hypothetical protein
MAPEAPGNLVVIDARFKDGELTGTVETVEYAPEKMLDVENTGGWFWVLWNEQPRGPDYRALGGGVVYINERELPAGYRISPKSPIRLDSLGDNRYAMRHVAMGEGIMFALVLPEGYTLADSSPKPRSAKIARKNRLAAYWKPQGKYGLEVKIVWQLKTLEADMRTERDRINAEIHRSSDVPDNGGVLIGKPSNRAEIPAPVRNPWISGSFYLAAFAVVVAILLAAARTIPLWALPLIIVGALCVIALISAFQLRQDNSITDKSLLSIIGLVFRQLPVLMRGTRRDKD